MEITLSPELDRLVREKVDSGLYKSQSEVISESLRTAVAFELMRDPEERDFPKEIIVGLRDSHASRIEKFQRADLPLLAERIKQEGCRLLKKYPGSPRSDE